METKAFLQFLDELGASFFTGVPDSLLAQFTDELVERFGIGERHVVAANEGAAVGLAAGHYLATGNPAVVYMQNSGIGNAMNPICSLLHEKVYAIPVIFVIGWRGEPGTKDEPQHVFQGEVTLKMLELAEIPYVIVEKGVDLRQESAGFMRHIEYGRSVAFVVKKDTLVKVSEKKHANKALLSREDALKVILKSAKPDDVFICTTGKLSREVYEIRKNTDVVHGRDFLTVGSMGHSLMIALGIAMAKTDRLVFCLDGDGSMLMHMGSVAVAGAHAPKNLVHIVINNGAHETVGGLPAVSGKLELFRIAKACGYVNCLRVYSEISLAAALNALNESNMPHQGDGMTCTASLSGGPIFVEVICNLHSRKDLGRPETTSFENKKMFMERLM